MKHVQDTVVDPLTLLLRESSLGRHWGLAYC